MTLEIDRESIACRIRRYPRRSWRQKWCNLAVACRAESMVSRLLESNRGYLIIRYCPERRRDIRVPLRPVHSRCTYCYCIYVDRHRAVCLRQLGYFVFFQIQDLLSQFYHCLRRSPSLLLHRRRSLIYTQSSERHISCDKDVCMWHGKAIAVLVGANSCYMNQYLYSAVTLTDPVTSSFSDI